MDVTIYVACFKGSPWLDDCLAAIRRQTMPPTELLVVADVLSDDLVQIARRHDACLIPNDGSGGLSGAGNVALANSTSEFLASVGQKVIVSPKWLSRLVRHFADPMVGAVMGRLGERNVTHAADRWRGAHMGQDLGTKILKNPRAMPGTNVVLRTKVIRDLGGYSRSYPNYVGDYDFDHCNLYSRLLKAGYEGLYEPSSTAVHLRSDSVASIVETYCSWLNELFPGDGGSNHESVIGWKLLESVGQLRLALKKRSGEC